jgi:hypothetical protein
LLFSKLNKIKLNDQYGIVVLSVIVKELII